MPVMSHFEKNLNLHTYKAPNSKYHSFHIWGKTGHEPSNHCHECP